MVKYKYNSLPQEIYSEYLKKIGDIEFTLREVDVIAFMLSGRSAKKTASFLSLSPKTIESYTRNIMLKLKCNSRDGIIDFMEKSHQLHNIQRYYSSLLVQSYFEDQLKFISKINKGRMLIMEIYYQEDKNKSFFIQQLTKHLNLAGIKVSLELLESNQFFFQKSHNDSELNFIVCIMQNILISELPSSNSYHCSHTNQSISETFLLLLESWKLETIPYKLIKFDFLELHKQKHYYNAVFIILEKVMPHLHLDISKFRSKFDERYRMSHKVLNPTASQLSAEQQHYSLKKIYGNCLDNLRRVLSHLLR